MEFKKCSRCGNFYVSEGDICPKCNPKENVELSTFKNYIEENGTSSSLESIAGATGISLKNLNRFLGYQEFQIYKKQFGNNAINYNNEGNNGVIFH